jgi:hypothetical protein
MAISIAPYRFAKHSGMIQVKTGETEQGDPIWADLPDPQSMECSVFDLDSEDAAGRDQGGYMFRDRRAVKEKLTCTFPPMIGADRHRMMDLVKAPFFIGRFWSDYYNDWRECEMYVGDRTAKAYVKYKAEDPENNWYEATSMNLIER